MEWCIEQLLPLTRGQPVVFAVNDPSLRRKSRVKHHVLFISPLAVYGHPESSKLLFSFPGYGSELLEIEEITASRLYRLGLTYRSAEILTQKLNQVFRIEERKHDHEIKTTD